MIDIFAFSAAASSRLPEASEGQAAEVDGPPGPSYKDAYSVHHVLHLAVPARPKRKEA